MRLSASNSFVVGVVIGAVISVAVFALWPAVYAGSHWPGYGRAAPTQPHEYNSSPVARNHAFTIFLTAGVLFGAMSGSVRNVVYAWLGLSFALLVSCALRPAVWSSNLAPLALILYPAQASLFLFTGTASRLLARVLSPGAA